MYQVHQMKKKTFEKLVKDPAMKPESVLVRFFEPSDFAVKDQVMLIKSLRDIPRNRNLGTNHVCYELNYCRDKQPYEG